MCLAIPARVEAISDECHAIVELEGVKREVATHLVDEVQVGDYLIIHVGYALQKLDEDEALKTLELFAELGVTSS